MRAVIVFDHPYGGRHPKMLPIEEVFLKHGFVF